MRLATVVMREPASVMRVGSREMAAGTDVMHGAAAVSPFPAAVVQRRTGVRRAGTQKTPGWVRLMEMRILAMPQPAGACADRWP
jgi:hypothetical protein